MAVKDFFIKSNDTLDDKDVWEVTPWQKDEDNIFAITKSKVDNQDNPNFEDYLDGDEGVAAISAIKNQIAQLGTQNGIYTAINNINNSIKDEKKDSVWPEFTAKNSFSAKPTDDEIGIKIQKIKNNKLKRIKLSSKFGLYNTYMNLLGNAAGLYIGSLGKTGLTQAADYALSKTKVADLTLGLGTDTIRRIVKAAADGGNSKGVFSSVDIPYNDIIELNLSNFFTIYTSRPGLTIRSTNELLQYVANNEGRVEKLLNSVKTFASKLPGIEFATNKVNNNNSELINLEQINNFEEKNTFLVSESDDNNKLKKISLPSNIEDGFYIKRGVIPQSFDVAETENYKNKLNILTKKIEEYSIDSKKYKKALEEKNSLLSSNENIKQQRIEYVKNTIIHSKARLNSGVEISSINKYINQRINYFKTNNSNYGIDIQNNSEKNIPIMMRNIKEAYYSNGGLYIEPFYGVSGIENFFIPFEFNPDIQENSAKAEYTSEKILGRLMPIRSYISSEPSGLTIVSKYLALEEDSIKTVNGHSTNSTKYWTDKWQQSYSWDLKKIQYIEGLYRSLVLPYIEGEKFVRPPIIRVIPPCMRDGKNDGQFSIISDLYSYPTYIDIDEKGKYKKNNFEITSIFTEKDKKYYKETVKRYVASDVQISLIDENSWGNNFAFDDGKDCVRKGFKVTVTLLETTKNFLDTIPSFASYVSNEFNNNLIKIEENNLSDKTDVVEQDIKNGKELPSSKAGMPSDIYYEKYQKELPSSKAGMPSDIYYEKYQKEKITPPPSKAGMPSDIYYEKYQNSRSEAEVENYQQLFRKNTALSASGQSVLEGEKITFAKLLANDIMVKEVDFSATEIQPTFKESKSDAIFEDVGENKGLSTTPGKNIEITPISVKMKM